MIKFASACIILTLAIILWGIRLPNSAAWSNMRVSRRILIMAYAMSGLCSLLTPLMDIEIMDIHLTSVNILVVSSYQTLFFIGVLYFFIAPEKLIIRKMLRQGSIITLFACILMALYFIGEAALFLPFFIICIVLFIAQCVFYMYSASRVYTKSWRQLEEFYDEDKRIVISWVKKVFYSSSVTVIFALIAIATNNYSDIFVVAYTTFYIFFGIKFANFRIDSAYVVKAAKMDYAESIIEKTTISEAEEHKNLNEEFKALEKALLKWEKEKKYKSNDLSVDEIVEELHTDRDTLRMYFRENNNSDFRQWRSELRINEAQRLIKENPEISLSLVSEEVGFNDKGNFHRQFKKFTGITPADYKSHCIIETILSNATHHSPSNEISGNQ